MSKDKSREWLPECIKVNKVNSMYNYYVKALLNRITTMFTWENLPETVDENFINCTAWNTTAVFISKFFDKGNMIAVSGELNIDNYTDKDGKNRTSASVHVSDVSFTGERFEPQNEPPKKE